MVMSKKRSALCVLAIEAVAVMAFAAEPALKPRTLTPEDLAKLHQSVQASKARSQAAAIAAERARQKEAREKAERDRAGALAQARREAQEAADERELRQEMAEKAAAWREYADRNERALAESQARSRQIVAQAEAAQAEAARRRAEAERESAEAERRRQVQLIDDATRRQHAEGARLAAQQQASEQARADKVAADKREADRLRAVAEDARQRERASNASLVVRETAATAESKPERAPVRQGATNNDDPYEGPVLAFFGRTCAEAKVGAMQHLGNGTQLQVVEEVLDRPDSCRVVVRFTSGVSGRQ